MDQETKDMINEYYKLKNTYELKNLKTKRKILRDKGLNKQEKSRALAEIKLSCVSCGKPGGSSFREEGTKLYASCLASKKSTKYDCRLDIEIDRGSFESVTNLYKTNSSLFEESRVNIIKTKLDMLFGYIQEAEATANFSKQKDEFSVIQSSIIDIHKVFTNIIQNNRNKKAIDDSKINMFKLIDDLNDLLIKYNVSREKSFINDAISTYVNELLPEANKLRELTYAKNAIECADGSEGSTNCDDTYHLIQEPYLYSETEIELNKPVIIKNSK